MKRGSTYRAVITDEEAVVCYHQPSVTETEVTRVSFQLLLPIVSRIPQRPRVAVGLGSYDIVGAHQIMTWVEYKAEIKKEYALNSLYDSRYELLKRIVFDEVDVYKGAFYLFNSDLGIYGAGNSIDAARKECASMVIALFEEYNDDDTPLAKDAEEFRKDINTYVRRRG